MMKSIGGSTFEERVAEMASRPVSTETGSLVTTGHGIWSAYTRILDGEYAQALRGLKGAMLTKFVTDALENTLIFHATEHDVVQWVKGQRGQYVIESETTDDVPTYNMIDAADADEALTEDEFNSARRAEFDDPDLQNFFGNALSDIDTDNLMADELERATGLKITRLGKDRLRSNGIDVDKPDDFNRPRYIVKSTGAGPLCSTDDARMVERYVTENRRMIGLKVVDGGREYDAKVWLADYQGLPGDAFRAMQSDVNPLAGKPGFASRPLTPAPLPAKRNSERLDVLEEQVAGLMDRLKEMGFGPELTAAGL